MFLSNYYKEKVLYERRLQLISILDDFAIEMFHDKAINMHEDDPQIAILRREFADVLNPVNVEEELKKIYPKFLYSPTT